MVSKEFFIIMKKNTQNKNKENTACEIKIKKKITFLDKSL